MSKCFKRTRTAVLLALAVLMSTLVAQPSTFAVARGIDHPPGPGVAGVQLFGGRPPRRGASLCLHWGGGELGWHLRFGGESADMQAVRLPCNSQEITFLSTYSH